MVIIESDFKPFRVEKIDKKLFTWKKKKNSQKFSEVKSLGHLQGILTENFFLHFYAQNDLILKIEQKKIFLKKNFFSEKKFSGPRKNGRFRPYLGQIFFFWHAVFSKWSNMICSFVLNHFQRKLMQIFFEKSQKPHFWPLFGQNLAKIFFFRKSGSVSIFYLIFANYLQKIRKIVRREV